MLPGPSSSRDYHLLRIAPGRACFLFFFFSPRAVPASNRLFGIARTLRMGAPWDIKPPSRHGPLSTSPPSSQ
jgi:hypothetical protein